MTGAGATARPRVETRTDSAAQCREEEDDMAPIRQTALVALAALAGFATSADEPCNAEGRRRLPAAEEFARLCPKDPVFAKAPREKGNPVGGCTLYFHEGPTSFVQVTAKKQEPRVSGGPKMGAQKAAEYFGKHGGGKVPAVKRLTWKSVEAWALEGMPGYYVDSGGDVLVVSVNAMVAKAPSDACAEAIVRELARRFAAR